MFGFLKATAAGLLLAAVSALAACQGEPAATTANAPAAAASAPEAKAPAAQPAAYVCPMRCANSESNAPGKCPVCGMDLEPNPAVKADQPTDSI